MEKIKELVEKHPYAIAGGVFVIGLLLIWWLKGSGSSSDSSDTAAYYGASSQVAQANAALAAAQLSAQGQLGAAQIQSNSQIATANDQLAALQSQYQQQTQLGEVQSIAGLLGTENTNAANLSATQSQYGYLTTVANDQETAATTQYNDQLQLGEDTIAGQVATVQSNNALAATQSTLNAQVQENSTNVAGAVAVTQANDAASTENTITQAEYGYLNNQVATAGAVAFHSIDAELAGLENSQNLTFQQNQTAQYNSSNLLANLTGQVLGGWSSDWNVTPDNASSLESTVVQATSNLRANTQAIPT